MNAVNLVKRRDEIVRNEEAPDIDLDVEIMELPDLNHLLREQGEPDNDVLPIEVLLEPEDQRLNLNIENDFPREDVELPQLEENNDNMRDIQDRIEAGNDPVGQENRKLSRSAKRNKKPR